MAEPRRSGETQSADERSGRLAGARILIVESRFYEDIADALLAGATAAVEAAGARYDRVSVPGALEVAPAIAMALDAAEAVGNPYDGAVALGCVIRGETTHYDYVCSESARGVLSAALETGVPVAFGVVTCETAEQAFARAGGTAGNKGAEAVETALDAAAALAGIRAGD